MKNKAKVILTTLSITILISGCSLFRHLDGSASEDIEMFRTGTPSSFDTRKLSLVDHLKAQREQSIIASKESAWGVPLAQACDEGRIKELEERLGKLQTLVKEQSSRECITESIAQGAPQWPSSDTTPVAAPMTLTATPSATPSITLTEPLVIAAIAPAKGSAATARDGRPTEISAVVAMNELKKQKPSTKAGEDEVAPASGEPKIKVVSGDGQPLSAKQLRARLKEMGYYVDRVDVAPFTFDKPVVFYAPGYKGNAQTLAGRISSDVPVKPLTWNSVYDIIVVSVN